MPAMGRMTELAAVVGSVFVERILFRQLMFSWAWLLMLAVVIGIVSGTFILGALYLIYHLLLTHGVGVDGALLAVGGVALLLVFLLALFAVRCFHKLSGAIKPQPALASHVGRTIEAFLNGLLTTSPKQK